MIPYIDLCLILLTYKSKILLLQKENVLKTQTDNAWHFIKKIKDQDASAEKTIIQEVQKEILITLDKVTLVSNVLHAETNQYTFHARLTDENVNNIARGEGHILQFFELKEVHNLQLQPTTALFFSKNKTLIENLAIS